MAGSAPDINQVWTYLNDTDEFIIVKYVVLSKRSVNKNGCYYTWAAGRQTQRCQLIVLYYYIAYMVLYSLCGFIHA